MTLTDSADSDFGSEKDLGLGKIVSVAYDSGSLMSHTGMRTARVVVAYS